MHFLFQPKNKYNKAVSILVSGEKTVRFVLRKRRRREQPQGRFRNFSLLHFLLLFGRRAVRFALLYQLRYFLHI